MKCWLCERPAHGVCQFCGRGVCKLHAQTRPHIISIFRDEELEVNKALVVGDALFCGQCRPHDDPIVLPDLG